VSFVVLLSCGDSWSQFAGYSLGEDVMQSRPATAEERSARADAGIEGETDDMAIEELELMDVDGLSLLISARISTIKSADAGPEEAPAPLPNTKSKGDQVPPAYENWQLSPEHCLGQLWKHGVKFGRPDFETPLVDTPILLEGPLEGVKIAPRWPRPKPDNAVMDCHLALALVELSRTARKHGIKEILFYSTYRPLRKPPAKCPKGKGAKRCRRQKRIYAEAKNAKTRSQHRHALAIDIRWLVTDKGETLDVLEHFDRKNHKDPCSYKASTKEGLRLQKFACDLHEKHTFNVMLTPNANKAHHNHFHFDITPDARWYIIR
jgi:hypothetical protein